MKGPRDQVASSKADETFQEKMVVWIQVLVVEDEEKCMDLR